MPDEAWSREATASRQQSRARARKFRQTSLRYSSCGGVKEPSRSYTADSDIADGMRDDGEVFGESLYLVPHAADQQSKASSSEAGCTACGLVEQMMRVVLGKRCWMRIFAETGCHRAFAL